MTGTIDKIGIIGGGIMGTGLVQWLLPRGFRVVVAEAREALAEECTQKIHARLRKDLDKGRFPPEDFRLCIERFEAAAGLSCLKGADFVIEAAPEHFDLKRRILREAEDAVAPGTILASNTSALPITALGACLKRPERFLGTHFFNPAQIMPLVEVVKGVDTAGETIEQTLTFLTEEGKKPIRIKDCPGFLVNRVLGAYMNEVMWLLGERIGITDAEGMAKDLGLPMGPVTLGEMVGWDIIQASNETLRTYYGSRFEIPPLLERLTRENRLGLKTGRGLLDHRSRPPAATHDIVPASRKLDGRAADRAKKQLLAAIWAESIRCLDEGVACAREIDDALVLGAGLPMGPLAWADETGLQEVSDLLLELTGEFGERFLPSPVLRIYAMSGYNGVKAGRGLAGAYPQESARGNEGGGTDDVSTRDPGGAR
ncbi:3-hydroxyacyl-CoA dehydrogenase [Desulfatiglans anilini]|uniref:3-hydroxyacyl-CoA dehydrogenase n=1 Tax=Desulfatiglans anilini TaxID=90728 RepID=UPI0003F608A4|nr:3-hydroxyacyl-CoA dehydrogenase [Desulfatiglans anilini]